MKNIILINPQLFFVNEIIKTSSKFDHQLFIVTSEEKKFTIGISLYVTSINYNNVLQALTNKNIVPDFIIAVSEKYLIMSERLRDYYNISLNGINNVMASRIKSLMKETWILNNIITPKILLLGGDNYDVSELEFPVIVKPSGGFSSCGVKLVQSKKQLFQQIAKIKMFHKNFIYDIDEGNPQFIVEEYIDGREYSIDTIWYDGYPIISGICDRGVIKGAEFPDKLYLAIDNTTTESQKLLISSYKAVSALGIKYGATHTEIKVKEGVSYHIESTCRPGGGGLLYWLFEKKYGDNFFEIFYKIETGEFTASDKTSRKTSVCIENNEIMPYLYFLSYKGGGIIKNIEGMDKLNEYEEVKELIQYKYIGDRLLPQEFNHTYFIMLKCLSKNASINNKTMEDFTKRYDAVVKVEYL